MAVSMLIPVYSLTAKAEIVEFLDPYLPADIRTGWYKFEHHDTDWDATVHTYSECIERARREAIQEVAAMESITDKTGYPFVKISRTDFLYNFGKVGTENEGFYFDASSNYVLLGKLDATLSLPAFNYNVSKI